jgi:serine/threonine protein phosphatase PrpC
MTTSAGLTDTGRSRASNEDAFFVDSELGLFVVADGMGGHRAGEVASRLAVDTVVDFVRASESDKGITWPYGLDTRMSFEGNQLRNAVQLANQRILAAAHRQPEWNGMGSTIVVALVKDGRAVYTNIGDSRLYLWRTERLAQLSVDHSWAATMLKAGADPATVRTHPMRHLLTRALGLESNLDVDVSDAPVEDSDLLVFSTDGLHGVIDEAGIGRILADSGTELGALARKLIEAANAAGGPDNVTVVLVRPRHAPEGPVGPA